ncbi:uncharacterized protein BJ171DRAFT_599362 [Polychytrium aggregatum]|uniref:uncharacterized protein n=1 Tax=Polychytrium aggregatum TaxID=110093 RepID=UPI0022FE85E5|nr:uncharacterized protein BJ171DRAFT_599362 [Polychytrium aggregatum]KAI9204183.1 hypothetical protein BJ171DRAFT_599362 [Polychytrium aggregatum]
MMQVALKPKVSLANIKKEEGPATAQWNRINNDRQYLLPPRPPPRLGWDLWIKVCSYLGHSPKTIQRLALVSRSFAHLLEMPACRAHILLNRYQRHLVFHETFERRPSLLTFEVCDALMMAGALLPKYFVERIYKYSRHHPEQLPEGTVEYLVAQGYKLYGERFQTILPFSSMDHDLDHLDPDDDIDPEATPVRLHAKYGGGSRLSIIQIAQEGPSDDANIFDMSFINLGPASVESLRKIAYSHHFTPALLGIQPTEKMEDLWSRLVRLTKYDPKLAIFFASHAGVSWDEAHDHIMCLLLQSFKTKRQDIDRLLESGFRLDASVSAAILSSTKHPIRQGSGKHAHELLCLFFSPPELKEHSVRALQRLFEDGTQPALRAADHLIEYFRLSQEDVLSALLVSPYKLRCVRCRLGRYYDSPQAFQPPVFTTYAAKSGGMIDGLWQLILGRYGVNHILINACLNDLIIGGRAPYLPEKEYDPDDEDMLDVTSPVHQAFIWADVPDPSSPTVADDKHEDPEADRDAGARESLEVLLQAGMILDPSIFAPISTVVFGTKKVLPRHLDVLARAEKGLLAVTVYSHGKGYLPPHVHLDTEKVKWSKTRWIGAFNKFVLADRSWRSRVFPVEQLLQPVKSMQAQSLSGGFLLASQSVPDPMASAQQAVVDGLVQVSTTAVEVVEGVGGVAANIFKQTGLGAPEVWIDSISERVGLGDLNERGWLEVRRFFGCVQELTDLLEPHASKPEYSKGDRPSPYPETQIKAQVQALDYGGPFTRWLEEMDQRGVSKSISDDSASPTQLTWGGWIKSISKKASLAILKSR